LQDLTWREYAQAVDALLGLLLGALLGFAFTGLQAFLDRRRRRVSLASALLIELRVLEHQLSLWYNDEQAASSRGKVLTPVFDRFTSDLLLLRHDHLYAVLHFYGFVSDVNQHLENARARLARNETLEPVAHIRIRLKAQFALSTIAEAKAALERAGGVLPPRLADHGRSARAFPPAPPRSFENYPTEE